jgi:hypothetical protein
METTIRASGRWQGEPGTLRPFKERQRSRPMAVLQPRIERIFTNGERLRSRFYSPVLFVLIRKIRGSNIQRVGIHAGLDSPEGLLVWGAGRKFTALTEH